MAVTEEVKIITIKLNESAINNAKKSADKLAISIAELRAKTENGKKATVEQSAELKALTGEYNKNIQVLKQGVLLRRSENGSLDEMAAQLSILRKEYKGLSVDLQNNADVGGLLQKSIAEISAEQKKLSHELGQDFLNVGNYEGALKDLKAQLLATKNEMIGLALAGKADSIEFADAAKKAGELKDQLNDVNDATKEMASGSKLGQFKDILGGVGNSLKDLDFDEAAEKAGRLAQIAKSMTFAEMIGGLKSLGTALLNLGKALIVNPFFAFVAAITAVGVALKVWYDSNQEAIAAQQKLNAEFEKAQFETKKLDIEYRKITGAITGFQASVEQLQVSHAEAMKGIADDTEKNLKESIGWWEKLLIAATGGGAGMGKIMQAVKERNQAEKLETIKHTKELQNLYAEQIQDDLKRVEEAKKVQIDVANEIAEAKKQAIEKENEDKKQAQITANKEATAAQLAQDDLREQYEKEHFDNLNRLFIEANNERIEAEAAMFNSEMAHLKAINDIKMLEAETQITDKKELEKKKLQITLESLEAELALMKEFALPLTQAQADGIDLLIAKINQLKAAASTPSPITAAEALGMTDDDFAQMVAGLEQLKQGFDTVAKIADASFQNQLKNLEELRLTEIQNVNSSVLSQVEKDAKINALNKKFAKQEYEIQKKQFETNKALSIIEAVIAAALGVVKAVPNIPLMLLAGAAGVAEIAVISAQSPPTPPSFATGGYVSGAGTGTSDSISARLSNGESVNTAKATSMFAPLLSYLNSLGGGVDWYKGEGYSGGGLVQKFAGGGIALSAMNTAQSLANSERTIDAVRDIVPVLVLEEFQAVQGRQIRTATNLEL